MLQSYQNYRDTEPLDVQLIQEVSVLAARPEAQLELANRLTDLGD